MSSFRGSEKDDLRDRASDRLTANIVDQVDDTGKNIEGMKNSERSKGKKRGELPTTSKAPFANVNMSEAEWHLPDGMNKSQYLELAETFADEERSRVPWISEPIPMEMLLEDYAFGSEIMKKKIKELGPKLIIRTRGDGNCFYRGMHY